MDEPRKLYWLASYPKSGNTWVRMFLDVYVTGYPVKFNSAYRYVNLDHDLGMLQLVSAKPVNQLTVQEQFLYQPAMLTNILHQAKTKDVVVKTHNARITVEGMPLCPTLISGGAIYIIRDPRDVVISYAKHLDKPIDETVTIMASMNHSAVDPRNRLAHIMTSWSNHVDSWTSLNVEIPHAVVRYEDLLDQPRPMFKNILAVLGITDVDEKAFDFALEQSSFEVLSKMEDEQGFIERSSVSKEKFFRVGQAGQWKRGLLRHQADAIFNEHADTMQRFGYII